MVTDTAFYICRDIKHQPNKPVKMEYASPTMLSATEHSYKLTRYKIEHKIV